MISRRNFLKGLGVTVVGSVIPLSAMAGYTHDTVFAVDVSASMPLYQHNQLLKTIQAIIDQASKKNGLLISFDTKVLSEISLEKLTLNTQLPHGCGADISCIKPYLNRRNIVSRKTVVFTDGYVFGNWDQLPSNSEIVIINPRKSEEQYYIDNIPFNVTFFNTSEQRS